TASSGRSRVESTLRTVPSSPTTSVNVPPVSTPIRTAGDGSVRLVAGRAVDDLELSIVMPCLNEAETLATCIRKARGYLARAGVAGEVVVADNGSTDGSREIAEAEGARVVEVADKGYGSALMGGIRAARGTYVIMGDADDSYDF